MAGAERDGRRQAAHRALSPDPRAFGLGAARAHRAAYPSGAISPLRTQGWGAPVDAAVEACNHSGGRAEIHFRGSRRGMPANAKVALSVFTICPMRQTATTRHTCGCD